MDALIDDLEQILDLTRYLGSAPWSRDVIEKKLDELASMASRALDEAKHWDAVLTILGAATE